MAGPSDLARRVKRSLTARSLPVGRGQIGTGPAGDDTTRYRSLLRQAAELERQDPAEAERLLIEALADDHASDGEADYWLARLLRSQGRVDESYRHFERALAANPNVPKYHQNFGQLLRDQRRDVEAAASMRRAVQLAPERAKWWHQYGSVLLRMGDGHEAANAFRNAIQLEPDHADWHYRLSRALTTAHRPDEVAALQRAVDLEPEEPRWARRLGEVLEEVGNWHGAATAFERVLRNSPEDAGLAERVATAYLRLGEGRRAADVLEMTIGFNPDAAHLHAALGEARANVKRSTLGLHPQLGITRLYTGDLQAAISSYHRAVALAPADASLHHRLGSLYEELRRYSEAAEAHERALSIDPGRAEWHYQAGTVYQQAEIADYERAVSAYESALDLKSDYAAARAKLTRVLARTQQWDKALSTGSSTLPSIGRGPSQSARHLFTDLMSADVDDRERLEPAIRTILESSWTGPALWWDALELRVFSLGWFSLAFDVKDGKAERTVLRQRASKKGSDPATEARVLCCLGRVDEALDRLGSIDRSKLSGIDNRILDRQEADTRLLAGEVEPLREVSRVARLDAPLPGEDEFDQLIRGRTVAIVGPADNDANQGAEIDGFDVIVRPKFVRSSASDHEVSMLGSRTDISYYAGRDAMVLSDEIKAAIADGDLKMAVARPLMFQPQRSVDDQVPTVLRYYRADMRAYFRATPLGIQRILYDVLQFEPAMVKIFNVDFFSGKKKFRRGYRDNSGQGFHGSMSMTDVFTIHDLRADLRLTKSLHASGLIRFDAFSERVVNCSEDEYLALLDAGGPF